MSEIKKQNDTDRMPRDSILDDLTNAKNKLISRREAIKKAGKTVAATGLVFLGLGLPGIPQQKSAACESCEGTCTGTCEGTCTGSCGTACSTSCTGSCATTCALNCDDTCAGYCHSAVDAEACGGTCSGICYNTCSGGCTTACEAGCSSNCTGTCAGTCTENCAENCTSSCGANCGGGCDGTCNTDCTGFCGNNCTGDCGNNCESTCVTCCDAGCSTACSSYCTGTCSSSCYTTCTSGCYQTCVGGCGDSCGGGCGGSCSTGCGGNCFGTCKGTCEGGCFFECTGGCRETCTGGCGDYCGTNCSEDCTNGCTSTCGVSVCVASCGESCEGTCVTGNGLASPKVEIGVVSDVDDTWTEVTLSQNYDSIVVVATANYDSGDDPAVVRIKDAGSPYANKFKIRVDPARSGTMNGIKVHYMVMEEGVYTVIDQGTKMEARKITSTVTDYKAKWVGQGQSYANSYTTPVVLGQVMSYGSSDFSTFWCRGSSRTNPPDSSNLKVGKTVSEDISTERSPETLGIIIIEENSSGTMKDVIVNGAAAADTKYLAALGGDSIQGVDNDPSSYDLGEHLSSASVGIASTAGVDESDGGWPILYGDNPVSLDTLALAIDEDNVIDNERNHTTEQLSHIVFE